MCRLWDESDTPSLLPVELLDIMNSSSCVKYDKIFKHGPEINLDFGFNFNPQVKAREGNPVDTRGKNYRASSETILYETH